jgi:pyruvate/2-oxoglutarate dehydrogenase complex dihydrolipoamide acyltransferase (E2) component
MTDPVPAPQSLFRQEALERVASPERLNVAARIVPASSWLLLLAVAIAVAAAIAATVLIDVPVRIAASGLLVSPAAPQSALAERDGRIGRILVAPGDRVTAGQALARLDSGEAATNGSDIASPVDGTVAEIRLDEGAPVTRGATVMILVPAAADAAPLTAALYLPVGDGKRIQPGMRVTIEPANARHEEYGTMIGRVMRVAALPISAEALERRLKNPQLVASLLAAGPRIEVEAALEQDAASPTGYRWTSSHGPSGKITLGTPCEAQITVERRRLLTLVIPAARRFFGTAE